MRVNAYAFSSNIAIFDMSKFSFNGNARDNCNMKKGIALWAAVHVDIILAAICASGRSVE